MARQSPERERLTQLINQWNVDHYELFELSKPNEDLEFHGVLRFYFQGGDGANVITKCVRVSSTATTKDVIETLIEKFRPDMRMLTQNKYALYEVHVNGEERRLADLEKPLWVQLNWGKDVREGRFLLKNENEETVRDRTKLGFPAKEETGPNFKRKLSKREKKEKKKRDQELAKQDDSMAGKLYSEAPESSFTRSISNPEAVMRRRRQQKLEKKLAQMQSREGGPDSGGTLKIYGGSLRPDVPYKTLLLSTADTTVAVVREAMEKYGLEKEDPEEYCLVEVLLPPGSREYHGDSAGDERVLDDSECPLAIVMQHPENRGHVIFQLRRRKENQKQRSKSRPRAVSHDDLRKTHEHSVTQVDKLPFLIELNPRDGKPRKHLLPLNVTEVGRDKPRNPGNQVLQLQGPDIQPRHCVIAHTEGIVTITPTTRNSEIFIDQRPVYETTMLRHGMTVQFGRNHLYRFVDPRIEEVSKQPIPAPRNLPPQETNFDLDGHVETVSSQQGPRQNKSQAPQRDALQGRSPTTQFTPVNGHENPPDLLPASLEYRLEAEDRLLQATILEVNSRAVQFKLAPTYTLYMAVRRLWAARTQLGIAPHSHSQMVSDFVRKTSKFIQQAIQEHHNNPTALAFWMANASEVLHFFKQDADIQVYSSDSQELLAEAVQMAFHHLVRCLQGDLQRVMPAFLNPSSVVDDENAPPDQYTHGSPVLTDVLNTLSAAMTLLRRCRVNAALTIQLFSQLFHFINMWLFNILVMEPQLRLCTRAWGLRLKRRLGRVEAWAEKQGLELAADCHLCRIIQAAHLLQAPKATADDITNISSTCFKLNSLQLRALLTQYIPDAGEPPVSPGFVERVVVIAENMADELTRTDGREVRLEEDADLHLPFLLPEDGYSCDTIRGIPSGLPEFVTQLTNMCHLVPSPKASGSWTVYMGPSHLELPSPTGGQPEIMTVSFKKVKGSMGLSIVAAVGEGLQERGIYIKSVVPGGAAALDGRLKAGDQLLEVDGKSLIGLSQDKAAELMTQTGDVVTLRVAKQGAIYHGLATLLSEPSPIMQRHQIKDGPGGAAGPTMMRGEEGPPPYIDRRQNGPSEPQRVPQNQQRPVPQPRGQAGQVMQTNRDGPDRLRSPSTGNLASNQYTPQDPGSYNPREIDPRSKSTSNLHVDTSFERTDIHPHMRGAASVGMLHPSAQGYPQYPPAGQRHDNLHSDYENQPQGSASSGPVNYHETNQNVKPGIGNIVPNSQHLQPGSHRPSDRSSVSSRTSSNSARDMRPQSAYYDTQASHDDYNSFGARPKSEDVTNKLREWQDKYDPHAQMYRDANGNSHSPPYVNQNQGFRSSDGPGQSVGQSRGPSREPDMNQGPQYASHNAALRPSDSANHSPPYTNIGAMSHNRAQQQPSETKLTAHQRLFGNQGATQSSSSGASKTAVNSQQRPPNFYENSVQEPPQPFQRLPSDSDKSKPVIMPKPAVATKKPQPNSQPSEVSYSVTDNRQIQPGLYSNSSRSGAGSGGPQQYQQAGYSDQRGPTDLTDSRNRPQQQDPRSPQQDPRSLHQQEPRSLQQQDPKSPQQQDPRLPQQQDPRSFMQDPKTIHLQDPRSFQQQNQYVLHPQDPRIMQQDARLGPQYTIDPRQGYSMQKFPSLRGDPGPYGYPANQSDLPPPPLHDLPPELPPPPVEHEELPPLPPPPVQDMYEQQLQEEQRQMMEALNSDLTPIQPYDRFGPPGSVGGSDMQPRPPSTVYNPLHHGMQQSQGQGQQAPNYQNINFVSEVRANSGPASQVPPPIPQPSMEHNVYEQYNSRSQPSISQTQRTVPASPYQQQQTPATQPPQSSSQTSSGYSMASAWDREEKEKAQELQAEELFRAREAEIAELESRMNFLSQPELERLRKLKLEHEFQRRVREIDEKGDYEVDDDDMSERLFTRERLIQSLKDDLEKSQQRLQELNHRQMLQDAQKEKERLQRLERRLEMMEKDKLEMKERMEKRSQRRVRDHQELLRQQREAREKQRQNYEEQKKLLMMEEEKMRLQREEEVAKRRQMERERLQELQIARDNEEARQRAEVRRQKDDYITQQMLQQQQQRQEQNREIRVTDERRRLESFGGGGSAGVATNNSVSTLTNNNTHLNNGVAAGNRPAASGLNYQQYMNLPPSQAQTLEKENLAPPPPERRSSYNMSVTRNNSDYTSLPFPQAPAQQPLQQQQNPNPAPAKKSVSFNTSMNTYQERTPSHSFSSDHNFSPVDQVSEEPNEVFQSPLKRHTPAPLVRQESTPNVIGSQEVYRDPRSRIEAEKAQLNPNKRPGNERMSFRDKMKYFAQEAGEDMPKNKPKASKTLRNIESQLNGQ